MSITTRETTNHGRRQIKTFLRTQNAEGELIWALVSTVELPAGMGMGSLECETMVFSCPDGPDEKPNFSDAWVDKFQRWNEADASHEQGCAWAREHGDDIRIAGLPWEERYPEDE